MIEPSDPTSIFCLLKFDYNITFQRTLGLGVNNVHSVVPKLQIQTRGKSYVILEYVYFRYFEINFESLNVIEMSI